MRPPSFAVVGPEGLASSGRLTRKVAAPNKKPAVRHGIRAAISRRPGFPMPSETNCGPPVPHSAPPRTPINGRMTSGCQEVQVPAIPTSKAPATPPVPPESAATALPPGGGPTWGL